LRGWLATTTRFGFRIGIVFLAALLSPWLINIEVAGRRIEKFAASHKIVRDLFASFRIFAI
jgi:hypothetical protein